jgi:hypothetical protein
MKFSIFYSCQLDTTPGAKPTGVVKYEVERQGRPELYAIMPNNIPAKRASGYVLHTTSRLLPISNSPGYVDVNLFGSSTAGAIFSSRFELHVFSQARSHAYIYLLSGFHGVFSKFEFRGDRQ